MGPSVHQSCCAWKVLFSLMSPISPSLKAEVFDGDIPFSTELQRLSFSEHCPAVGSVSGDGCARHRSMGIVISHELLNPHMALESPHTLVMTCSSKIQARPGHPSNHQPDSYLIQIIGLLISLLHSYPQEEIKLLSGTRNPFLKFSHRGRKLIRSVGL